MSITLDPIQYEVFSHRLFNILEEGRIAMKMVSGSPVVVEGGETMCSFYTSEGTPILAASGILLHCTGARDFVLKAIEMYEEDPGIEDGDQFFFNDPYIGGQHLPDQIIIKPIFYQGKRIAWVGSFLHTPETGGIEPGGQPVSATEIFHEGIRILGLKIVEKGKFRKDVFQTIIQQVRDPHLIGLDAKARIAANNVCAREYLKQVERYGLEFVEEASQQIIRDAEKMARARLRVMPDGVWRSRVYADTTSREERPLEVRCTMTKEGDNLTFDFTGSSPQVHGSSNSTLAGTWGSIFVVLASQLFWNVPWNGGMIAPVKMIAPEGSMINCRFPAACSNGVIVAGAMVTTAAHACVARMIYASGLLEDVNSAWRGPVGGVFAFAGVNQYGNNSVGVILDAFCAGLGATPARDGVDTGGNMMNPSSTVSDVEIIELSAPFMYLTRRNSTDSGGFGKYRGGMGPEMAYMVHGTNQMQVGTIGAGRLVPVNWGMFGGYPGSVQESRFAFNTDIASWLAASRTPNTFELLKELKGQVFEPPIATPPRPAKEGDVVMVRLGAGGGYGDPLDRDPAFVQQDVRRRAVSLEAARNVYGVVLDPVSLDIDRKATDQMRAKIRDSRRAESRLLGKTDLKPDAGKVSKPIMRIQEYLEVAGLSDGRNIVRCTKCGHIFCNADENYKQFSLYRERRDVSDLPKRQPLSGDSLFVVYQEYYCPDCATLIQVDNMCPDLDQDSPILWDIQVTLPRVANA